MKSKQILIAVVALLIVLGIVLMLPAPAQAPTKAESDLLDTSTWKTFESKEFQFTAKYPPTWTVRELYNDPIAPRINFYKTTESKQPPFDHHSQVTQVSFFPHGVPTEGVFGEIATSTVQFNEPYERAYDFLMDDKMPWATIISPVNPPAAWTPGFIWIEAEIANHKEQCTRAGQLLEMDACDFYGGDNISRTGTVNAAARKTGEEILKTFKFIRI